ncbi:metal ABC transporter permease [Camelliibacillus cellulosilyticus]|uniref:Metal ABC transporter permease n=1 Tax=Camelliibacillus cellulosilyticus TaxID=2174486 RepID=A0ABV9GGZ2_9BACL
MEALSNQVLIHALISGLVASVACGIIGVIVLEKKIVMLSGGISHTAIGGVGLGYFFHFPPMLGAVVVSVLTAMGVGRLSRRQSENGDVLIGVFWAVSMALGVLLTQLAGKHVEFDTYLFGDIFNITTTQIWLIAGVTVLILFFFIAFYQPLKAYLFDEEFAAVQGIRVTLIEMILYVLLGLATISLINMIGFILMIAFYAAPAAMAKKLTKDFKLVVLTTILLNMFFVIVGLALAYVYPIASGAAIIFVTGFVYFLTMLFEFIKKRTARAENAA